ncbi:MAG: hypothetical protein ACPGVO_22450 [Spirulinaceae cyanobacterium]
MAYTLLFLMGLGALAIARSPQQDSIHRLAWGLTSVIALGWSYLWSPAQIQLGLPLLLLVAYPLAVRIPNTPPPSSWD